ncbi:putative tetratricopeptide-like helical domain superfamily [Helianthus annuus]|nr:putative tetratricopeptide-like helical domain superfamily [Helianthus annuus]
MNFLVHVYCDCWRIDDAYKIERALQVFDEMPISVRDAATWGTMLAGYAQTKHYNQCLSLYGQMLVLSVPHDNVSLVSVLSGLGLCMNGGTRKGDTSA